MLILAIVVVINKNPIYSVLSLICTFICASILLVIIGADYLAMTLIIVYVGAVTVLFLFVVMMLELKIEKLKTLTLGNLAPLILFIALFISVFYKNISSSLQYFPIKDSSIVNNISTMSYIYKDKNENDSNIKAIGEKLYTDYFLQFQTVGLLLLVAMIGAIVLGFSHKKYIRRQNINKQLARNPSNTLMLIDAKSGAGVKKNEWMNK